jgi:hypothetical protein
MSPKVQVFLTKAMLFVLETLLVAGLALLVLTWIGAN